MSVRGSIALEGRALTMVDKHKLGGYVGCYALFAVVLLLAYLTLFIWRVNVMMLLGIFLGNKYASGAAYLFIMVLIGIALLIVVLSAEPYLRKGVGRHQLVRRFAGFALPMAAIVAVGLIVRALLLGFS